MKRRQTLRLGGVTLIVPLGGCTSIGETEDTSEFTLTKTGGIPVEIQTSEFARSYPGQEPFAEIVFGEISTNSDRFHGVESYTNVENPVDISLTINKEVEEETLVLEGEGTIAVEEYMVLAISRPDTYITKLEVNAEEVDLQKTFDVPQSVWDAAPSEDNGLPQEHNVHIHRNQIKVRFVGDER